MALCIRLSAHPVSGGFSKPALFTFVMPEYKSLQSQLKTLLLEETLLKNLLPKKQTAAELFTRKVQAGRINHLLVVDSSFWLPCGSVLFCVAQQDVSALLFSIRVDVYELQLSGLN